MIRVVTIQYSHQVEWSFFFPLNILEMSKYYQVAKSKPHGISSHKGLSKSRKNTTWFINNQMSGA